MPLQNRVTPFGEIIAIPQRGMFTGNRGIIHDPATRMLTRRRWSSKAWLVCSCDYKGVRRAVMGRRSWTELFFLDEATALAAGHRPCFACRRAAAEAFRAAWTAGKAAADAAGRATGEDARPPRINEIDAVLHRERLDGRAKRLHPLPANPRGLPPGDLSPWDLPPWDLPVGAMLAAGGESYLAAAGRLLRWAPDGYRALAAPAALRFDGLLTPPSTLRALAAGYRPVLHASARETLPE